jgi:hypothetical protein
LLESIFGPAKLAIQILIILMLLGVLAWVLYVLNVKLPKLPKINVEREEAPKQKQTKTTPYVTRESQTTSDSDLLKKLAQAT